MSSLLQQLLLGLVLTLAVPMALAATDAELRVAVIYNIARFVQWPTVAAAERFNICTLGSNAVADALPALNGKALNGVPTRVRAVSPDGELSGCHLLYVTEENGTQMPVIAETLASGSAATLTVSDASSFLTLGGMVQLVVIDNRLRFRINQALTEKAELGINAKLLQLALPGID